MKWTTSATVPREQNYADKLMEAAELCKLIAGAPLLSRSSKIVLGKKRKTEGEEGREGREGRYFLPGTTHATVQSAVRILNWDLCLIKSVIKKYEAAVIVCYLPGTACPRPSPCL